MLELKNTVISDELKEQVNESKSDNQACRALADAGVDVEAFEKELPDDYMNTVAGGWEGLDGRDLHCPHCGNNDRDEVSYQIWASMFMDSASKYRCKKCNHYFKITSYGECVDLGPVD